MIPSREDLSAGACSPPGSVRQRKGTGGIDDFRRIVERRTGQGPLLPISARRPPVSAPGSAGVCWNRPMPRSMMATLQEVKRRQ